ncbi:MAG TPA: hypothetical protein VIL30_26710 [Ramlibacter sp.]|jgi:hypothetical protein
MRNASRPSLPPAGRRWGRGAQSVVPFLAAAARSRPGQPEAANEPETINNPVFRQMEIRLVWRDR